MTTAREAAAAIREVRRAEDLFGTATTDSATRRTAHRTYLRLAAALHPDRVPAAEAEGATAAFVRLGELYRSWLTAGRAFEVCGVRGRYRLDAMHARGSVADVYRTDSAAVVKIA